MFSKPVTLIVVTRDRLIRADFASARAVEPTSLTVAERPHLDDPVALVESAIGLEKRKPGRVFVLCSDFFTHSIALASANTRDLSAEDLQQMLNFEAETISNISAFDATSAALPLGEANGQRNYWLTQISTSVRDQIDDAVRKLGGKLIGIAHPGGVPLGFDERPDVGMPGRVEFWPNAAVRVVCVDGVVTKAHVDDGAVVAGWVGAVASWKKQSGATHVAAVVPEGLVRDAEEAEPGTSFVTLEDEPTLRRWLGAWHSAIGAKTAAVPVILPAVRKLTQRERNMASLVLGAVVFAACYGHHHWVSSNIDAVAAERKQVEEPGIALAAAKTQLAAVEKDLKKASEEKTAIADKVVQAELMFDVHRRRLAELMRRLADDSSHEWVIQKITGTGREIKLHGVTMHPEHISELTAAITSDFGKLGWGVDPAKQEARYLGNNGGPWGFEILLRDLKPQPKPAADPSSTSTPPSTIVRVPAP
jgi:hypothetical protein